MIHDKGYVVNGWAYNLIFLFYPYFYRKFNQAISYNNKLLELFFKDKMFTTNPNDLHLKF